MKAKLIYLVRLLSERKKKNLICSENYLRYTVSEGFYLSQKLKDRSKTEQDPHGYSALVGHPWIRIHIEIKSWIWIHFETHADPH
jgi:hypothetical protein